MLLMWSFIYFSILPISANPSVLIIGAGPAGIAAATKLLENKISNITILEAENRIGGRIHSIKFKEGIIDLGAQYCHGEKGNVAYQLAKDYNILQPGLRGLQNNVYYSNGSRLDSDFIRELQDIYLNYHKITDNYNVTGRALGEMVIHKYNSILLKKHTNSSQKIKIITEGLRFLEGYIVIHEGSFSWFDPSAECDYRMCPGNQALIWKDFGYKAVLDIMMKTFPDSSNTLALEEKVHLNTKTNKILWNHTNTVQVLTSNGNYSADYLIFTPSIGVLKKNKNNLFDPQLPRLKLQAIENTGFDGVMKVFISFSTQWWNKEDEAFSFFWNQKDITQNVPKNQLWITYLRYILKVSDNPNVWVGWISGALVPQIEKLPLEELKAGIEKVLNTFLEKKYTITSITDIIGSSWCTNENFGGTYSYTKTGFYKKNISYQKNLGAPLIGVSGKPVVLFAGEATNPIHYSTVHGAIESGYREAERVINLNEIL